MFSSKPETTKKLNRRAALAAALLCLLAVMTTLCVFSAWNLVSTRADVNATGTDAGTEEVTVAADNSGIEAYLQSEAEIEAVGALIDALPNASEVAQFDSDEEVLKAYYDLQDAYDAYDALSEDQQARIATGKIDALFDYFNGQIMLTSGTESDLYGGSRTVYYNYIDPNGGSFYTHVIGGTGWTTGVTSSVTSYTSNTTSRILSLTTTASSITDTQTSVLRAYHYSGVSNVFSQNKYIVTKPTRSGFTFSGWAYSSSSTFSSWSTTTSTTSATIGGTAFTYYILPTSTTDYYVRAKWGVTLNYSANGGSGAPSSTTIYYKLPTTLSSTKPTRTGYTFLGWSTSSTATSASYSAGGSYTYSGSSTSVTLYAVWKVNSRTVTFDYSTNGGSWTNTNSNVVTMTYGSTSGNSLGRASSTYVKKDGYTLLGWYTTSTGGTKVWDSSGNWVSAATSYWNSSGQWASTSTSAMTVYARFSANSYTIKFSSNGGSGSMSSMSCTYGTSYTLTANSFTRTGYTFSGWNTASDGSGTSYANKASVKNLTTTSGGTVTLYAQWTAKKQVVTFDENGGSGISDANRTATLTYNSTTGSYLARLKSSNVKRTGYTLTGWKTSDGKWCWGSDGYYDSSDGLWSSDGKWINNSSSAFTCYAQWTENSYTLSFNANGGSLASGQTALSSVTLTYTQSYTLPSNPYVKTGYHFLGWSTSKSATEADYTAGQSVSGLKSTNGGTCILYAVWEANTYTIHFLANGGTGSIPDQEITYGVSTKLTSYTYNSGNYTGIYRDGYTFVGWIAYREYDSKWYCTSSSGSSSWQTSLPDGYSYYIYKDQVSVSKTAPEGDVYMYAIWQKAGANFDLDNVISDDEMFYADEKLVGGNGTSYSSSKVDSEWAKIDSDEQKGYLTGK